MCVCVCVCQRVHALKRNVRVCVRERERERERERVCYVYLTWIIYGLKNDFCNLAGVPLLSVKPHTYPPASLSLPLFHSIFLSHSLFLYLRSWCPSLYRSLNFCWFIYNMFIFYTHTHTRIQIYILTYIYIHIYEKGRVCLYVYFLFFVIIFSKMFPLSNSFSKIVLVYDIDFLVR